MPLSRPYADRIDHVRSVNVRPYVGLGLFLGLGRRLTQPPRDQREPRAGRRRQRQQRWPAHDRDLRRSLARISEFTMSACRHDAQSTSDRLTVTVRPLEGSPGGMHSAFPSSAQKWVIPESSLRCPVFPHAAQPMIPRDFDVRRRSRLLTTAPQEHLSQTDAIRLTLASTQAVEQRGTGVFRSTPPRPLGVSMVRIRGSPHSPQCRATSRVDSSSDPVVSLWLSLVVSMVPPGLAKAPEERA